MVNDKPTMIVNESIRRMMDECVESVDIQEDTRFCLMQMYINPEEIKRLAALNNVMMRIIQSVNLN